MSKSKPIVAALSGGVDSSVMAALLVEQGKNVVGITMRLYNAKGSSQSIGGRCCGPKDIEDARQVAEHLGIPFYVVDFEVDFEKTVMDDFVETYLKGETPNPCVKCNQHIKFTPLLRRARALGAEYVATGHYARLIRDSSGRSQLYRGVDHKKDQSYFLFSMPENELDHVLFPLGSTSKDEVREMALKYNLPVANKPDSQEICFVPDGDYASFVEKRAGLIPVAGDIVNQEGLVLGRHKGVHRFTVGQRRGLGNIGQGGPPLYVMSLDTDNNRVVVGPKGAGGTTKIAIRDLRWLGGKPEKNFESSLQIRYRGQPHKAKVFWEDTKAIAVLDDDAICAPGQAAVFYDGERVVGGGWIDTQSL